MARTIALAYSFLFGLLHGILPDEHTWPITFSYAIGGASGREGTKAAFYFSSAFTVQRMLLSELAYLVLAPFLLSPALNAVVYMVVGAVMTTAGAVALRRNRYPHFHLVRHAPEEDYDHRATDQTLMKEHASLPGIVKPPPVHWTLVHGFIAGFGVGGFSLFVNTVATPAMRSPWIGFLPGLFFGLGTMITLIIVGALFGASLRWIHALTGQEVKMIGAKTGGRTLFYGGFLFALFGFLSLFGLNRYSPVDTDYLLIVLFMVVVAAPAVLYSVREGMSARKRPSSTPEEN